MQSGQRTLLQDESPSLPSSLAVVLATLIDRRARVGRETKGPHGPGTDGNVLIWLDHPMLGRGPVDTGGRGVIVVTHDANQAVMARSFVVSYPVEAGGEGRQLGTVSDILAAMGWSLLASNRRKIELGHADTAVLDNTSRFGGEQRLWLAEPVEADAEPGGAPMQYPPRPGAWSEAGNNTTA